MNYTPRSPRLISSPMRVKLAKAVAREYAGGANMGAIKRSKIAPHWIVQEVKNDMTDQGLLIRPGKIVMVGSRKPEIDRESIARRMNKTLSWT